MVCARRWLPPATLPIRHSHHLPLPSLPNRSLPHLPPQPLPLPSHPCFLLCCCCRCPICRLQPLCSVAISSIVPPPTPSPSAHSSIASTTALAAATHSFLSYSASSVAIAASPHRCHLSPVATASSSQPLLPQPSPSSPLPSSSIAVGPLTLKHQQRRCYLVAPHLLGAPHDAVASSLAVATLVAATACNRALTAAPPCCHRKWEHEP
ncbi:hypothetical protein BHE74_00037045 [Ensete ventricosum]|nr:hypothetical protein BHE74_00037045 [Ensete ventricosum]